MSSWILEPAREALGFPRAWHRHANGVLEAVRDRTPTVAQPIGGRRVERWTYGCPCGEAYVWERPPADRG